jgi:prepilin-type N-terminal cleavage/methylation domain-containing protein
MNSRDGGFTLIEALVATAVFALVLSALYQGLTVGWRGLKKANAEDAAVAVLSFQLATSGVETPLQASSTSGTTPDGVSWQTVITPYSATEPTTGTAQPSYLGYWVTVIVRWTEGRFAPEHTLRATTLKLKKAAS